MKKLYTIYLASAGKYDKLFPHESARQCHTPDKPLAPSYGMLPARRICRKDIQPLRRSRNYQAFIDSLGCASDATEALYKLADLAKSRLHELKEKAFIKNTLAQ